MRFLRLLPIVLITVTASSVAQLNPALFAPPVTYRSGGRYSGSVAVADVNGDSKPDVLVGNWSCFTFLCRNGSVGVLLGNGDETFQPAVTYSSGGQSRAVGDVNRDGKPDLLVASSSTVGVLLGNGDGTFQPATP